jgi:hypothetical protein
MVLLTNLVQGKSLRELSVKYALKTNYPPVLDGKLNDKCWQEAPTYSRYQSKAKQPQKTELKIVWTEKGIYLGIKNYERNIDSLKAKTNLRDGGRVWADDCSELYIDPTATGYTMFKFEINSIAAIADVWQVDMGFTDTTWNAASARASCGKTADAWNIEFFVSWVDLKKKPEVGDIWCIIHRRLSWTSGILEDYSSSGGRFHDRKFGYLYFMDKKLPPVKELGNKLLAMASPEWVLPYQKQWIWAKDKKQVVISSGNSIILEMNKLAQKNLTKAAKVTANDAPLKNKTFKLQTELNNVSRKDAFSAMKKYNEIATDSQKLIDEFQLMKLISD